MYNSQQTAERIKLLAKERNVSISKLLIDCSLNKNALYTMQSSGYYPRVEAILKIADYLDCSVDYLLGRTDVPTAEDIDCFNKLNDTGQKMAIEYIRMLSHDEKYSKKTSDENSYGYEIAAFGGKGTKGVPPEIRPEITT